MSAARDSTKPSQPSGQAALDALARRHVRFGVTSLFVFAALGVLLEALHGFKVGFYLEVDNEARRLAFRLGHAHGALFSLVNVVFGLWLASRVAPERARAERASPLFLVATLLLPGGFLLGGLFLYGGDPGLGILLVPAGALALLAALLLVLRGPAAAPALSLREIRPDTAEYDASFALRRKVLREPLGLTPAPEERTEEAGLRHLGAFDGERLVGCLMLHDLGEGRVRMRQVAVDFDRQRHGIGKALVRYSEAVASRAGFTEMMLHAREPVVAFYESLGYEPFGEPFVEVTIPHRKMRKRLSPPTSS